MAISSRKFICEVCDMKVIGRDLNACHKKNMRFVLCPIIFMNEFQDKIVHVSP